MQKNEILLAISKHLSDKETAEEKNEFLTWLNENNKNKELFNKIKRLWNESFNEEVPKGFFGKFSPKKISDFIANQALGNFVGFYVGLTVTNLFSHHVMEKRGIKNLFGLAGRKQVKVNDAPEWVQWILSVLVGFIVLELVNHFIQTKKHLILWGYIKKRLITN